MNTTTSNVLMAALQYAEVGGYSVIPVGKDKKPLLSSWKEYQTRRATEDEIRAWWQKFPNANIGIVTGKISNLTVIDVDSHSGGSADPFPKTHSVKTGNGGLQLYYKYAPGLTISANAYPEFPHVDIRSEGGFVVAPPSRIIPSKPGADGIYEVVNAQAEFTDFPIHLFGKKTSERKKIKTGVTTGSRNNDIASTIGTLLRNVRQEDVQDMFKVVQDINLTYKPPLPLHELQATFESILSKELSKRPVIAPPPKGSIISTIQISKTENLAAKLRASKNGVAYRDMMNALIVIRNHPTTKDKLRYNSFTGDIEFDGETFSEKHLYNLQTMMQEEMELSNIPEKNIESAVKVYAHENEYDEAKDWLISRKWDGTPRLFSWLSSAAGLEDDEYHQGVGTQWFMGMIRRIMEPGAIFDHVLVAIGAQGVGKTSMFRILGGRWYKSFNGTLDNKDFYMLLRGGMIVDLDEGATMYKSESIKIKSMITQTFDEYRAPYDRYVKKYPRRFVFAMTTNDNEPFKDITGNRRYWVIDIQDTVNFKWLEENRDQLFAEAYHHYYAKTKLPEVPQKIAMERQESHLVQDEWTDAIAEHILSSHAYLKGSPEYSITLREIYEQVLNPTENLGRLDKHTEMRIGGVLRSKYLGLEKRRMMIDGVQKNRYFISGRKIKEIKAGCFKHLLPKDPNDF